MRESSGQIGKVVAQALAARYHPYTNEMDGLAAEF
jgi:hypothetical protein